MIDTMIAYLRSRPEVDSGRYADDLVGRSLPAVEVPGRRPTGRVKRS